MSMLEQKVSQLTYDLERCARQLRMLGDMGRAVASRTELDVTLKLIVVAAVEMSGGDQGTIYELDDSSQYYIPRVMHGMREGHMQRVRSRPLVAGDGEIGQSVKTGKPWEAGDVLLSQDCDATLRTDGEQYRFRAVVSVPIVRGDTVLGVIVVRRSLPGVFGIERIGLLQVAAQSTQALQNDRRARERDTFDQQKLQLEAMRMAGQLIEAFPNPIFFKGVDGRCLGVNKAWEAYFGMPRAQFVGKTVHDLYPRNPEIAEWLHAKDLELLERPGHQVFETVITKPDGQRRDVSYYKATFTSATGEIRGLIGTIVDISARKRIDRYRRMEDAVTRILADAETPSEALTKSMQIICGRLGLACGNYWRLDESAQVLRSSEVWHIDAPEVADYVKSNALRVIEAPDAQRSGSIAERRGLVFRAWLDGAPSWFRDVTQEPSFGRAASAARAGLRGAVAFPVVAGAQNLGVIEFFSREPAEIDEDLLHIASAIGRQMGQFIRRRESEARSSALEAASTNKSQFLANMSHELRTPLNAIIGYSEMLIEDATEREAEQFIGDLAKIRSSGKHLLELINDILDLSKIEAGKMDLHSEDFDVAQLIEGVAETIRPMAQKNGNQVKLECAPDLGILHADATRVRQALLNLTSNAVKFTQNGLVTISGSRHIALGRETIALQVRDSGIGMTPEQIGRLFRDFEQADGSTTRKYGGTGLGLAISRRFCRMMGGDIVVHSAIGRGSTFTIQLPCAPVTGAFAGVKREATVPQMAPAILTVPPDTQIVRAPTVLVVDNDAAVCDMMERLLQRVGFAVITAATVEEALARAKEHRPDIITLEVAMPGVDGWALLKTLKSDPALKALPVIVVSITDERQAGYAQGAAGYLVKPVDRKLLTDTLLALCAADLENSSANEIENASG